jgi:hypothetical protein
MMLGVLIQGRCPGLKQSYLTIVFLFHFIQKLVWLLNLLHDSICTHSYLYTFAFKWTIPAQLRVLIITEMGKNDNTPKNPMKKTAPVNSRPSYAGHTFGSQSTGNNTSGTPSTGNPPRPPPAHGKVTSGPPAAGITPGHPSIGNTFRPPSADNGGSKAQFSLKSFSLNYYDKAGNCKPYPPTSREFVLVSYHAFYRSS